jgi:hypothetical protein
VKKLGKILNIFEAKSPPKIATLIKTATTIINTRNQNTKFVPIPLIIYYFFIK